uniref:H15 domain-containing protein n=1 Tax=Culex tarsalis TaxID=7177 RepID=A0A1Q3FAS2_CULTA
MSTKEATAKLPKKAGGTPAQPTMLTKIVAALLKSELKDSVMRNKGMPIVPSISNWIVSKWSVKPANHLLRAAIDRGTQISVLQKPATSRTGLNGTIKIHPKFAKLLADRNVGNGDDVKEVASAIATFIRKPRSRRSSSPEPKPVKPKKKAAVTAKKPKADFPVASKMQAAAGAGTSKKRPAKDESKAEPKAKKAKK